MPGEPGLVAHEDVNGGVLAFQFAYSASEHASAIDEGFHRSGLLMFWLTIVGILVSLFLFRQPRKEELFAFAVVTALMVGVLLTAPALTRVRERRKWKRENADDIGRNITLSLTSEGIHPTARWSIAVPWSKVREVVETKRFFVLYATSDGPFFIPKHAVSSATDAQLRQLLQKVFSDRPRALKLLLRPDMSEPVQRAIR